MTTDDDALRCQKAAGRLAGKVRRTCRRWDLLSGGETLGVAVSGGADSLVMTELLLRVAATIRDGFELIAFHVALDGRGVTEGLPAETRRWLERAGIPLRTVPPRFDAGESAPESCFRCARIRRRTLLEAADAEGVRYLALGHHADDVVETWLMSLFFTGTPEAMPPRRSYFGGAVTVVRPLFEIRRREIGRMARLCALPVVPARCPLEETGTRRDAVRRALASLGRDERLVRRQLFWAAVRALEAGERPGRKDGHSCGTVSRE